MMSKSTMLDEQIFPDMETDAVDQGCAEIAEPDSAQAKKVTLALLKFFKGGKRRADPYQELIACINNGEASPADKRAATQQLLRYDLTRRKRCLEIMQKENVTLENIEWIIQTMQQAKQVSLVYFEIDRTKEAIQKIKEKADEANCTVKDLMEDAHVQRTKRRKIKSDKWQSLLANESFDEKESRLAQQRMRASRLRISRGIVPRPGSDQYVDVEECSDESDAAIE